MTTRRPLWTSIACAALLAAVSSGACLAQGDEQIPMTRHRATLAQTIAPPCVAVAVEQATILLSRSELERATQAQRGSAEDAMQEGEPQRLAWIAGRRAQGVLDAAGDQRDRFGCALVAFKAVPNDSLYLLGQLLERGQAAVWIPERNGFAAAVEVAHFNPQCQHGPMGSATYRVADDGPLLLLLTECVT